LNGLALTYLLAGRYAHAAAAFERVLALRPGYPGARTNLEYARGKMGR
jgi:Flp pilus assembly protein TadD